MRDSQFAGKLLFIEDYDIDDSGVVRHNTTPEWIFWRTTPES